MWSSAQFVVLTILSLPSASKMHVHPVNLDPRFAGFHDNPSFISDDGKTNNNMICQLVNFSLRRRPKKTSGFAQITRLQYTKFVCLVWFLDLKICYYYPFSYKSRLVDNILIMFIL